MRQLANSIFQDSRNFVKLSENEFTSLYEESISQIEPNFVEIVETLDKKPVGFCFSIPNPRNKTQMMLKTIGVIPSYQRSGVGSALLYSQHKKAQDSGFEEFYYPLIRVGNNVTKLPFIGYTIVTEYHSFTLST